MIITQFDLSMISKYQKVSTQISKSTEGYDWMLDQRGWYFFTFITMFCYEISSVIICSIRHEKDS